MWTDTSKELALYYGAVKARGVPFPSRITKVLNAQGELVLEYVDAISVGTHPQDVLDDCTKLFGPAAE